MRKNQFNEAQMTHQRRTNNRRAQAIDKRDLLECNEFCMSLIGKLRQRFFHFYLLFFLLLQTEQTEKYLLTLIRK